MSNSTKNIKVIAGRKAYSEPVKTVASTSYTAGSVTVTKIVKNTASQIETGFRKVDFFFFFLKAAYRKINKMLGGC